MDDWLRSLDWSTIFSVGLSVAVIVFIVLSVIRSRRRKKLYDRVREDAAGMDKPCSLDLIKQNLTSLEYEVVWSVNSLQTVCTVTYGRPWHMTLPMILPRFELQLTFAMGSDGSTVLACQNIVDNSGRVLHFFSDRSFKEKEIENLSRLLVALTQGSDDAVKVKHARSLPSDITIGGFSVNAAATKIHETASGFCRNGLRYFQKKSDAITTVL